ncbi:MAG: hypothetical protein HY363_04735 [Candidatus Aenigmarchaeota archaeon]|nr:hypothetical protein [Candidatus Aenigmarchaeota archaeon]
MNPLTHGKFSFEWLGQNGFKLNEPLVILGSVLPDFSLVGVFPERQAHTNGIAFLNYLQEKEPLLAPLGVGFMLHGEKPNCLDYFTHKRKGYIAGKSEAVSEIVERAKLKLDSWYHKTSDDFVHSVIEFSGDTLIEPEFVKKLHNAFTSVDLQKVSFHVSNFFKSDQKSLLRALRYFKMFDFGKLQTTKGIVHSIQDFAVIRAFSQKNNTFERYAALVNRLNFWRAHKLVEVINKAREVVAEDYHEFLAKTNEKIKRHTARHVAGVLA